MSAQLTALRTEAANINNVRPPKRERRPSHSSTTLPRRRNSTTGRPNVVRFASTNSSSTPNVTSSSSGVDPEEAERARLYAFETQQMARERNEVDGMLAAQIAEAEAEIRNAEARLANRREREQRERLVEGMYGAYTYDGLNAGASRGDYYSPRLGMSGVGGGGLRHETRRLDGQRSSRLPVAVPQQGGAAGAARESGRERGQRFIGDVRSGRHRRGSSSHYRWEGEESGYY
ncbi:hypothetical protein UCRNP2_10122 [Neofusicoccum parvum UCRNP2]|uniref:Uncharacterized protein n=1 Tax=Botryosphaeria parva (strain UCR-NP2) TaxID=1287680 RepID=R1E6X6_BOTPV|nr:hypothetical protein UCRNP2_10122 [Neofusicoccum parvum UCRNP2]